MTTETMKLPYVSKMEWNGLKSHKPIIRITPLAPESQISGTFDLNVGKITSNEGRRHFEEKFCYRYKEKPHIKLFPNLKNRTVEQIYGPNDMSKVCIPPKRKLVHEKFFKHNKIDQLKIFKPFKRKIISDNKEEKELVKNLDEWKEKKMKDYLNSLT